MKIRIKKGAYSSGNSSELTKFLNLNAGKLVDVETDHLFSNQYNTAKFRIFDNQISEVVNDARVGKGVCKFCGCSATYPKPCNAYTKSKPSKFAGKSMGYCKQYGTEWFTPENTYFLKYPKGFNEHEDLPEQMIGTYKFRSTNGFYWLHNARKVYKFRYDKKEKNPFVVFDGMNIKNQRSLSIPLPALKKLLSILNK